MFKGYPSGVRFVEFTHGGKDTKYWAGHFGVKLTNCGVFIGKKRSNKKKRVRSSAFSIIDKENNTNDSEIVLIEVFACDKCIISDFENYIAEL